VLEGDDYTASMKTTVSSAHSAAMGFRSSSSTADTASREHNQRRCFCARSRQLAPTRPNGRVPLTDVVSRTPDRAPLLRIRLIYAE
jgi:hypothetical protein